MNQMSAEAITDGLPLRRGFAWSRALAGLTPSVALGIAALLFVRIISASLAEVVVAVNNHDLQAWIPRQLGLYCTLLVMAVPMVIGITATANLGPQRGARRIAALAAAVIVSTGVGVLLRVTVADYFQLGSGLQRLTSFMLYTWPRYAVLGGLLTAVGEFYRREVMSLRAMREAEEDRATFEREMLGARFQGQAADRGGAGRDGRPVRIRLASTYIAVHQHSHRDFSCSSELGCGIIMRCLTCRIRRKPSGPRRRAGLSSAPHPRVAGPAPN